MNNEIEKFIEENPDWYLEDDQLVAGFEFADFDKVKKIIGEVMDIADKQNHHPAVTFGYNTVEVKTVTHDAGNTVTDKDFALATAVSKVVEG